MTAPLGKPDQKGFAGRRLVVTGGAGFIGSHLAHRLAALGAHVAVIDDLSSGSRENLPADLAGFFKADIRDRPTLGRVFSEFRPEIVFHQAAQISVSVSVREPAHDASINIMGLLNILEECIVHGVSRFVFASSGGTLYGEVSDRPARERDPLIPKSPYGIAKQASEGYLDFFSREHGLESVSLRYANVYGPRQDPQGEAGVVAIFSNLLLSGQAPTIFGDGSQVRDYIHVADVVEANIAAALAAEVSAAYNIGTGVGTDVNTLYAKVTKALGAKVTPIYGPARPGDLQRSILDATKAAAELGWTPSIALDEGIKDAVDWFSQRP